MTSNGALIKDLPQDYRSNLLIYFNTENTSTQGT
jgi:hypothetical protein